MVVKFWGVRGSYPVPGIHTNKYGGNTPCVEVRLDDGTVLIFDAGTGIRELGLSLMHNGFSEGNGSAHVFITHMHWDHIQGFPFFSPVFVGGNRFTIYARKNNRHKLRDVLAYQNKETYSPISFNEVRAKLDFVEVGEGRSWSVGEAAVKTVRLNHPSIALGYRVDADDKSFAYITDTAPFEDILIGEEFISRPPDHISEDMRRELEDLQQQLVGFVSGADLIVYDAFFRLEDYRRNPHWGHSTPEHGIDLCKEAGIQGLALFHHAPGNSDDVMDQIDGEYRDKGRAMGIEVFAAKEGQEIRL